MNSPSSFFPLSTIGSIVSVHGSTILARLPRASVGDLCWIETHKGARMYGQIISFQDNLFSLSLFHTPEGVSPGTPVRTRGEHLRIPVGESLLGRVIDPLGNPVDNIPSPLTASTTEAIFKDPPPAATRPLIDSVLTTGIRSIDGMCTIGHGQRIGICASAGIGKSTLLGMIARNSDVDIIVVGLVGERSREVREFIEETLGPEGLARSVVVVAASNQSSLLRQTAPYTATTIAEYFRDQGKSVLLIIDSLTRMARAIRETSLSAGELPVRHGYTTSVYTELPKLLERAGNSSSGSITAVYTVLTNTDDDIDPMADEIKSLLDGHLVLRPEISHLGIQPAIDITQSISRVFRRLNTDEDQRASRAALHAFTRLLRERDIIALGGTPDAELQRILNHQDDLLKFLSQTCQEKTPVEDTREHLRILSRNLQQRS
jgi:type III secretion protein N (ATPase)